MSSTPPTRRSGPRLALAMFLVALGGMLLAIGVVSTAAAPVPEDSEENVTIVVRGMMKSRSGAT